jgi:hypothetical protein
VLLMAGSKVFSTKQGYLKWLWIFQNVYNQFFLVISHGYLVGITGKKDHKPTQSLNIMSMDFMFGSSLILLRTFNSSLFFFYKNSGSQILQFFLNIYRIKRTSDSKIFSQRIDSFHEDSFPVFMVWSSCAILNNKGDHQSSHKR